MKLLVRYDSKEDTASITIIGGKRIQETIIKEMQPIFNKYFQAPILGEDDENNIVEWHSESR